MGDVSEAQKKLAKAGVFKGYHGLEGLVNAQDFWDLQPYGTRLYYGAGIADYLHRDVLQTAIKILNDSCETKLNAVCVAGVSAEAECLSLKQQLTTLQAEKEAFQLEVEKAAFALTRDESEDDVITVLQVAAGHLEGKTVLEVVDERDELKAEKERLEGELGRLRNAATELYNEDLDLMSDGVKCVAISESAFRKLGEAVKHPTQEPTNGS